MRSDDDRVHDHFLRGVAPTLASAGPDEDLLGQLAALPPMAYDRERVSVAERAGVRASTLDAEVARRRPREAAPMQGRALTLPEIEQAADAVDGERLLTELAATIRRHVVLSDQAAQAVALWILRSHAHDRFAINPRLAILSPTKRCGKTTLLELVAELVPRPLLTSNVTPAALFRTIEAVGPTLLVDEVDSFQDVHEELRGILNSGHTRATAQVVRCTGDDHEPRAYSTWAPMALACIGTLPDTVIDRSIAIQLQRRARGETVTPLRRAGRRGAAIRDSLHALARACARWVQDHAATLAEADPAPVAGLHDRAADNWSPLLAIADTIGGQWPDRARAAAVALSGGEPDTEAIGIKLLTDIRAVFDAAGVDRLSSTDLCDRLAQIEEAPWGEYRHGKPLNPVKLAKLLRPFGVRSKNLKMPDAQHERPAVVKGYEAEAFREAWTRYIPATEPDSPSQSRYPATLSLQSGDQPLFQSATELPGSVSENATIPPPDARSSAVAAPRGENGVGGTHEAPPGAPGGSEEGEQEGLFASAQSEHSVTEEVEYDDN